MKDPVLFSIIVPCYNRGGFIQKTISSICNQTKENLQVIIINDGSTDNTRDNVRLLCDDRVEYYEIVNSERGAARNFGLGKAKGKYVNFFDSDDIFLPCLDKLVSFINEHTYPDVIYGEIERIDEMGNKVSSHRLPYKSFTKNILHNNFLACGSVFIKRQIANEFLFHEDRRLSSAEDWELWLRLHTHYTFMKFPGAVFQQVQHTARSLITITPEKVEVRDTYFASLLLQNGPLIRFYGLNAIKLFTADRFTFISLAWCGVDWQRAFFYWHKALKVSLKVVIRKRFWAILKKLLFRR